MYALSPYTLSTLHVRQHWHADLFRVTRRDGKLRRFTSTMGLQLFGGEIYRPTPGERRDTQVDVAPAAGDCEIRGACTPDGISSDDVEAGFYDDALVEHKLIDWRHGKLLTDQHFYVESIEQDQVTWRATLLTLARQLRQSMGPIHNGLCSAIYGDNRCKAIPVPDTITVTAVSDVQQQFDATGANPAPNWYALGFVEWLTGNNKGSTARVFANSPGFGSMPVNVRFALGQGTRFPIRIGDTAKATTGCDGLAATCKNKHGNLLNFRGNERQRTSKALILARGTIQ